MIFFDNKFCPQSCFLNVVSDVASNFFTLAGIKNFVFHHGTKLFKKVVDFLYIQFSTVIGFKRNTFT